MHDRRSIFSFLFFLRAGLLILSINGVTSAANYFVSTSGNDANNCTSVPTACLTIQAAVNKSANGDVVFIGGGTFTGSVNIFDRSNMRFVGTGSGTIISPPGPAGPSVAVFNVNASRLIEFSDFRVTGHASSDGFRVFNCTAITFNRLTVDSNGGPGGGFFINGSLGTSINQTTVEDNGVGIRVDGNSGVALSSPRLQPGIRPSRGTASVSRCGPEISHFRDPAWFNKTGRASSPRVDSLNFAARTRQRRGG